MPLCGCRYFLWVELVLAERLLPAEVEEAGLELAAGFGAELEVRPVVDLGLLGWELELRCLYCPALEPGLDYCYRSFVLMVTQRGTQNYGVCG